MALILTELLDWAVKRLKRVDKGMTLSDSCDFLLFKCEGQRGYRDSKEVKCFQNNVQGGM